MNRRLIAVRARRERLIALSAAQRDDVALLLSSLRRPLQLVEGVVTAARYARSHAGTAAMGAIALALIAPRRALHWLRRGFLLWRGYRWVLNVLGGLTR
jgi:YqjK-like protein